jgi:hypothetical protein
MLICNKDSPNNRFDLSKPVVRGIIVSGMPGYGDILRLLGTVPNNLRF